MKFQNVYESNFDYDATYENLLVTLKGVTITRKGLISFRFKPQNIEVLLSPKRKVQVAWASEEQKEQFMPVLNSLLKPPDGQKLTLKPLHTNILKVPYPGPEKFTLAWCKERISFVRNLGFWNFLKWRIIYNDEQRNKELKELRVEDAVLHEEMRMNPEGMSPEEKVKTEGKYRKLYGLQ